MYKTYTKTIFDIVSDDDRQKAWEEIKQYLADHPGLSFDEKSDLIEAVCLQYECFTN